MIKTFLLQLAHSRISRSLIGWGFAHMTFALPVHRLRETPNLIAFDHPKPGYPVHILLVPKKAIPNLASLGSEDTGFMLDLFNTVRDLVKELKLEVQGYRLIANGGAYQEVPQLHFHLISGEN